LNQLINAALDQRWSVLQIGLGLVTPDIASGSRFSLTSVNNNSVEITTNGGTSITINRQAFFAALDYLVQNQHTANNPCQIGSNMNIGQAGPLCVATRNANGVNIMISSYTIPLLAAMNLVDIDGNRPNTTWLI